MRYFRTNDCRIKSRISGMQLSCGDYYAQEATVDGFNSVNISQKIQSISDVIEIFSVSG